MDLFQGAEEKELTTNDYLREILKEMKDMKDGVHRIRDDIERIKNDVEKIKKSTD